MSKTFKSDVYLGIDVGTSSVKAVAVTPDGEVASVGASPLDLSLPRVGWVEQSPESWWIATCKAVSSTIGKLGSNFIIHGIGLSGQMQSLVAIDRFGEVIRPSILWNDVRTTEQCDLIRSEVGNDRLRELTGNPALEGFTATKILWLRHNEPENYDRLKKILLPKDYIRYRMTGNLATEPSDAAATLLFDIKTGDWSVDMVRHLGLDASILPPIIPSFGLGGRVTNKAAKELGISKGIHVVAGGADNACAAAGAGVVSPGSAIVSTGTSGTVVVPVSEPLVDPDLRVHAMNHIEDRIWYLMGVVLSAGAALSWWRNTMGAPDHSIKFEELISEASKVRAGSEGLFYLPYLSGERTPHADSNARGVFSGLHSAHSRGHMTRAVMEGVSFALKDSMTLISGLGQSPKFAISVGGGARSVVWRQIQADILELDLHTVGPAEGAPFGAAMLAATGTGLFQSVSEAAECWVKQTGVTEPDSSNSLLYRDLFEGYRDLYLHLRPWFAKHS